jgi:NADH-quinone oxidoreductase subunit F
VTDRVDPSVFEPERHADPVAAAKRVAVVGAGPAGLTAAHCLSLRGYRTTVFEAEDRAGGMLVSGIPAFRLPRDVLQQEIEALIDENITLRCGTALGRDFTVQGLLADGYEAVFLAVGAHRSRRMGIDGEASAGVYPSIEFLKAWNLRNESLGSGKVGVVGGGNSAVDAARVAVRQTGVSEVTIFYRRTRREMPAYAEEIEAALDEGVRLEELTVPTALHAEGGRLVAAELTKNELGEPDASGRRRPIAKPGSETTVALDTLIVAIGEESSEMGRQEETRLGMRGGVIAVDARTLATEHPGVFAGGDLVTGPNTVIDAIAAGRRAAEVIGRYLSGSELLRPEPLRKPSVYMEPIVQGEEEESGSRRVELAVLSPAERVRNFAEVEATLTADEAAREARRCLRCDLEFTRAGRADAFGEVGEA